MPNLMQNLLLVMLGASLGGACRYLFTLIETQLSTPIQISTLLVNIIGGLLAGIIAAYLLSKPDQALRLFLIVGFCGGLTTFSSFSLEAMKLLQNREFLTAFLLIIFHFIGAIGATFIGFIVTQRFIS
ncbi:fluoride efflux transporter FluC [Ignatzschineria cameli]|uniref:Fluoride-specific ion channel FluC n=1 Tax=Ignatzschineria cameli TaxID=2182793 RepID=A0A2U2AJE3_9GAMM|nr:CrcB family protein [Ignatzschineria cameli]PWD82786.1 fluoride efflux transporter CrcB [Ignatzschineria cameli]PWD83730.1 fluoride efflux transporter CrcB [Ignatzschineria cameli]PWD86801.1 fluoride efflux transporter CrcB [Ignatzschineria cameli]PWD88414.1 fluoride efflux transporter CrcB [Ignatzschineria cameli]PWD90043.1 fluoride efflux transporter CrcB [Ignatzschineria cameli]